MSSLKNKVPFLAINGDGIGPSLMDSVIAIHNAANSPIDFIKGYYLGEEAVAHGEEFLSRRTLKKFKEVKLMIKSPLGTQVGGGEKSPNVQFRQEFDLYINLRPVKSVPSIRTRFDNVDIILLRENTEDLYSNEYTYDVPEKPMNAIITFTLSAFCCDRIVAEGVRQARLHNKKKICIIHKANIIKPYNFMIDAGKKYAALNPDLQIEDWIVDAYCMKVVEDPTQFEVVVAPNMFGDIISDLHAGMIGGLGLAASANLNGDYGMFEAVHGTGFNPDPNRSIVGKNIANPTAVLYATLMGLHHIGDSATANKIEAAVLHTYATKRDECTKEKLIGGKGTTTSFTNAVIASLQELG